MTRTLEQLYFDIKSNISRIDFSKPEFELYDGKSAMIDKVKEFAQQGWELGELHGISHWERVEKNGLLLATKEANKTVVRLFAYLHDKWRIDDGEDLQHGTRAAENLTALRGSLLSELSDEEFELLCKACELHTVCHRTGNITIDTCFDADRLDLTRVGILPRPSRMATPFLKNAR